ncbi:hypothetical protein SAY87_000912 [Trapa incisa]|uniref:Protein kinase domain-containing protein n=1 Tax=Trapa incisa TaxID=236973 RepID=A0AAN7JA48_9MYRT|nr:hypothetical protein SAY87_000912 [Trapa incisa]
MLPNRTFIMALWTATSITISILTLLSPTTASNSMDCNRTCGNGSSSRQVNYPFGFSPSCPIQINCTDTGVIKIDQFQIHNITGSSIFIDLPTECYRSISSVKPLFGSSFSPSWTNGLILQNCNTTLKDSSQETRWLETHFGNCKGSNITYFFPEKKQFDVISYDDLDRNGCDSILSSIAWVDEKSLRLETMELVWWLNDVSHGVCDLNATKKYVKFRNKSAGIRCLCNSGFEGDGFTNGTRCRRGHDHRRTPRIEIVIGGLIAGAILATALAVTCFCMYHRISCLRQRSRKAHLLCEVAGSRSIPLYTYKEIDRSTNGFSETLRRGTGAYGTVYAGRLHDDDEWVAIKRIRYRDPDCIDQIMNEIKLLSSVSHPNLVRLLGCCIEKGEQILVYEYMPNGTLLQHLMREKGRGLPWTVRLRIAAETAGAIAYLHSEMNPPIFHRDIKSDNILLDFNYNSKVADFGLSRLGMTEMNGSHISTAPQGTPGYVDPQYHQQFQLSDKSDVYSFGVVLVEIITALKVVDFSRPHSEVNLAALALDRIGRGCVYEIIDPFIQPRLNGWTLTSIHKVAELAFQCLAYHRDMRPSMTEVAEELKQILISGWVQSEEGNMCRGSSSTSSSLCSRTYNESEKSFGECLLMDKGGRSWRSVHSQQYYPRPEYSQSFQTKKRMDVSEQRVGAWSGLSSSQSSPSENVLLRNMAP